MMFRNLTAAWLPKIFRYRRLALVLVIYLMLAVAYSIVVPIGRGADARHRDRVVLGAWPRPVHPRAPSLIRLTR